MNTEITSSSSDLLARQCAEESSKHKSRKRDDRYCFELVKRAFALNDHEALGFVLDIYKTVWSRNWIRDAHEFESHVYTAEDFKSIAFFKVYRTIGGSAFDNFPSFTPILDYLHKTLVRIIAERLRSADMRRRGHLPQPDQEVDPLEQFATPANPVQDAEKNLGWQAIDQHVARRLPAESDQLLFNYWLKQRLTREEIVQERPDLWPTEDAVRVAQQRIKRRLYKDVILFDLVRDLL